MMGVTSPPRAVSWLGRTSDGTGTGGAVVADPGPIGPALPAGGYMGEGIVPIPEKVVKQILLAFVEMGDLHARCEKRRPPV